MSQAVEIDLPLEPESARRAREQLNRLQGAIDPATLIDLRLLVDELVVEAVHSVGDGAATRELQLRAEVEDGRARVVVVEGGTSYHLPSRRPEPGDPGFGLHLVQRLSDRWGIRRDRDRATVWLELMGRARR